MKALELATKLENGVSAQLYYDRRVLDFELAAGDAASELRRLAKVNAELLEALIGMMENCGALHGNPQTDNPAEANARAAIAKAKEQQ